ncbi:MAG: A/G-specific adenine glycosylase [Methylovulum sp.]|uniref:A/G-specific adenine glycosylase n=1 Tax=Methylovulum sp. TaxID=1916980 RepID=UPI002630C2A2|nr:A/G-specific adenine glycosylase [Methylovulum sp.]MDD2723260.1 A/G-specific adenine glycosylase [Methylovulum sp.]MDD5123419.1 A/G-specific adenine glycosylase [Methylovulum sp.]
MTPAQFQHRLLTWFDQYGRKNLPWQQDINPYRVWLSETMLQQTQVATVIPYFLVFTKKFPNLEQLAAADIDDVLQHWAGLGYYARARNLHKAAQAITGLGYFPDTLDGLLALPGIGQSTAGAILSIAFNDSHPILDGNVKRVLTRLYGISGWPGYAQFNKTLWVLSRELTPKERVADYTQAIMDLGATLCTRSKPLCLACPVADYCIANNSGTTSTYPSRKPSKTLPVKQSIWLVLHNPNRHIWLEKRPPTGIWGGLWSLPEFASIAEAEDWCLSRKLSISQQYILPSKRHTFSHYHLDYTPLIVHIENLTNNVMEANQSLWYNSADIDRLGLAAPIKSLLQQLNTQNIRG